MIGTLITYLIVLTVSQIVFFVIPFIYGSFLGTTFGFSFNVLVTWFALKQIEMLYYKKYDKLSSMLYNICPLIGVSILLAIIYFITRFDYVIILLKYYVPLFMCVYVINLIYIIYKIFINEKSL
ncbi:MAG TPA: hypothetical protein PLC25_01375 [Bacilli bacterium]|nr:hypothetical protein [Bacilli bacterium]